MKYPSLSAVIVIRAEVHHLHEAGDVPEASQGAVGAQHVCRDDDAPSELHAEHRRPGDHRVPAEGRGHGVTIGEQYVFLTNSILLLLLYHSCTVLSRRVHGIQLPFLIVE